MHKYHKIVIYIIIIFIAVINVWQVSWVINAATIAKKQYKAVLDRSLSIASTAYADIKTTQLPKKIKNIPNIYLIGATQKDIPVSVSLQIAGTKLSAASEGTISVDTLTEYYAKAYWVDMADKKQFDLPLFDSLFKNELQKKKITAGYHIDTAHVINNFSGLIDQMSHKQYPGYPLQTWAINTGTFSNIMIWAAFKPYPVYFSRQVISAISVSLLVLAIANGGLLFILRVLRKERRLAELKNDFVNNITHELKTPVAVIHTVLDALLDHKGMEEKQKLVTYLVLARKEAGHLSSLIEKIAATAADNDQLPYHPAKIDVDRLITDIVEKFSIHSTKKIIFDFERKGATLFADSTHFNNLLNNLVENAIKYSGSIVCISITYNIVKGKMILAVSDTGIGIAKQYHKAVFDKFFRVPTGDIHDVKGSGLGLSHVKKIVEQHKGSIQLKSEPGKGSIFIIELPYTETE